MSGNAPLDVNRRTRCEEESAFYQPKKLILFSIIAFLLSFLIARAYNAFQRTGLIISSPNVLGNFHLHHWAYSLMVLSILIVLAFYFRKKKKIFGILIIFIAFFLGLFMDGIVYPDSTIFFE